MLSSSKQEAKGTPVIASLTAGLILGIIKQQCFRTIC
jgi:hypothetical protein